MIGHHVVSDHLHAAEIGQFAENLDKLFLPKIIQKDLPPRRKREAPGTSLPHLVGFPFPSASATTLLHLVWSNRMNRFYFRSVGSVAWLGRRFIAFSIAVSFALVAGRVHAADDTSPAPPITPAPNQ